MIGSKALFKERRKVMKIPSSKSIATWVLLISMCALSVLLIASCQTTSRSVVVTDTTRVVIIDTVKETRYVSSKETEKMFQSIIEKMETQKSDFRTLILSEKGDTIKEFHETVVETNNSTDTEVYRELYESIKDSISSYKRTVEELIQLLNREREIAANKPPNTWLDNVKNNIFYIVVGIVVGIVLLIGIIVFVRWRTSRKK